MAIPTSMASLDEADPETVMSHLAWRSIYTKRAMVEIKDVPIPGFLPTLPNTSSSAGLLDTLPLEVLHLTLDFLDFRSLFSLLRANTRCRTLVESLPAYKRTVTHATGVLAAMNRTKVLLTHSTFQVYAALCSESCLLCNDYGPFLFLLTAERCCLNCLRDNPSLRVFSLTRAASCFGLTRRVLQRLPTMRGLPGVYCVGSTVSHQRSLTLVRLNEARAQGIAVHGSEAAMQAFANSEYSHAIASYRAKSRSSRSRRPTSAARYLDDPNDHFCGMASTPSPSFNSPDNPENGLWCLGCHDEFDQWGRFGRVDPSGNNMEDDHVRTRRLWRKACKAWSRSGFLDHVQNCQGALSRFREIVT